MFSSHSRAPSALVAAVTAVVITVLSVAVPLLDQGRDPGALAFTERGAPAGYVEHHHGVCVQHGAAAWSPATGASLPAAPLVREDETIYPAVHHTGCLDRTLQRSRAPPLV